MIKNYFYSINKLMSYNAMIAMVLGERGCGKTYQGKKKMIDLWRKKRKQSVYIRRTVTEIDTVKDTLFNDIAKDYPDLKIEVVGYQGLIDGEVFCYFIPLSSHTKFKSSSYPDVDFAFFDEYIISQTNRDGYLKNEAMHLLDLLNTIFRQRRYNLYIASNSISYVNPLFEFYGIEPKPNDTFIKAQDGLVVVEITRDTDYSKHVKMSDNARLVAGTSYYDYAINNNVLEDTSDFIVPKKPEGFDYNRCAFRLGNYVLGCWSLGATDSGVYVNTNYDKSILPKYTVYSNQNYEGWRNIKVDRNNWNLKYIKKCFLAGRVWYCNQEVKQKFINEVSKYL